MAHTIDTEAYSATLRARAIDPSTRSVLITDFRATAQSKDLTLPPNCGGFGRIRHFRRSVSDGWPANPLPMDPACRALGLPPQDAMLAQVFQNAACNWRCWYCYVPFNLLAASERHAAWFTAEQMVNMYLEENLRPAVLDLSGGQPDLVPEWIPWMMAALKNAGLERTTFLWSDDNLSTDYYFKCLSPGERKNVREYKNYARVCCFKGYDPVSFAFNTRAAAELFDRQFIVFRDLLREGIDLYAYVTLTTPNPLRLGELIPRFMDRLQELHPNLPLRTIPLRIEEYSPVGPRMSTVHLRALAHQRRACDQWLQELSRRFSSEELGRSVVDVPLKAPTA